jgi:5'-nucleotidase
VKIILTNDDGIEAPGLETLFRCVKDLGEIILVAPRDVQSGIAHRVTTRAPIQANVIGQNRFSIDGTPADCARIALKEIASDAAWLISGINSGANLGSDIYNSGTVAAAREAAILGTSAIAISQYIARDKEVDWNITEKHAERVLKMLLGRDLAPGHFWNVNLPHPTTMDSKLDYQFCSLDANPHNYEYSRNGSEFIYKGSIHERPRDSGKDVAVCFDEGKISITRVAVGTTKLD